MNMTTTTITRVATATAATEICFFQLDSVALFMSLAPWAMVGSESGQFCGAYRLPVECVTAYLVETDN